MSTVPSVLALGQLFELCKRHSNVLQLLVSNPTAVEALSKHPEQALAALNRLDVAQDLDEPEIPYGLSSMGTADMLARVRDLSALEAAYDSCDTTYAHIVVNRTLGGNMRRPRVVCASEKAQRTGCSALLFMRGPHQPYMPDRASTLGVLLSATPRVDWPAFENVFISQTKDYGDRQYHADDWVYAGRYELKESRPLDVDEVAALPEETIKHWTINIGHQNGIHLVRSRARVYLGVIDERETITEADITRCIAEHGDEVIKTAIRTTDIRGALLDGTIVLQAFAMRPVGYDVGIPLLLEQTRKRLTIEQEAEDIIEVIPSPPRGTKRKAPPSTPIERPRPGPGPSTSSLPPLPRPKRNTANNTVNYCEYDSEYDYEPTRL